jgi:hypothetical protein
MPKSLPTPAVSPIASAPQKATRTAPLTIDAPPACAAVPPRITKVTSAVADETSVIQAEGASKTVAIGTRAPTMKAIAEARAACTGRARRVSEMPSSSRRVRSRKVAAASRRSSEGVDQRRDAAATLATTSSSLSRHHCRGLDYQPQIHAAVFHALNRLQFPSPQRGRG